MSEPVALFSTSTISPESFSSVLTSMGGTLDSASTSRGQVSREKGHVWLFLQSEDLTTLSGEILEPVCAVLGGVPRTNIVLEIGRHPGSNELALEVARAFAERWPVVWYNLRVPGRVFSQRELLDWHSSRGLT
jgi:hypothetical protein